MAKLHIYKTVGNMKIKIADGDGNIDKSEDFSVTLTAGKTAVKGGETYEIRQGQSVTGTICNCKKVVASLATFGVSAADGTALSAAAATQQGLANFYAALDAVSKSVTILIDQNDLQMLKANNYALCFAKKVGSGSDEGSYNVVWQSLTDYTFSTAFSWTPQFSLFATNTFSDTVQVVATTNAQPIGLGEQAVLNDAGWLDDPSTGGSATGVTLVNQYQAIHPALSQISTVNGHTAVTPLYVAPDALVLGSDTLTPIETVLVWFEQKIQTSTMFSTARSNAVEIDLTFSNSATRAYQSEKWVTPGS